MQISQVDFHGTNLPFYHISEVFHWIQLLVILMKNTELIVIVQESRLWDHSQEEMVSSNTPPIG